MSDPTPRTLIRGLAAKDAAEGAAPRDAAATPAARTGAAARTAPIGRLGVTPRSLIRRVASAVPAKTPIALTPSGVIRAAPSTGLTPAPASTLGGRAGGAGGAAQTTPAGTSAAAARVRRLGAKETPRTNIREFLKAAPAARANLDPAAKVHIVGLSESAFAADDVGGAWDDDAGFEAANAEVEKIWREPRQRGEAARDMLQKLRSTKPDAEWDVPLPFEAPASLHDELTKDTLVSKMQAGRKRSAAGAGGARKKPRAGAKDETALPLSTTRSIFSSFATMPIAPEAFKVVAKGVDHLFKQVAGDLAAFCDHGGRKTIEKDDAECLFHRQRLIDAKKTLADVMHDHMPMEFVEEIVPVVLADVGKSEQDD